MSTNICLVAAGLLATWFPLPGDQEARTIPLESIYSTNGQKGPKPVAHTHDLEDIKRNSPGMGASNIFLVHGKDFAAAVKATRAIMAGGRSADVPATPYDDAKPSQQLWVVAYFGASGSDPSAWLVRSVEVKGQAIRVTYFQPARLTTTGDTHLYFVWIPLGEAGPGTYTLELFNAEENDVSLQRRVKFPAK